MFPDAPQASAQSQLTKSSMTSYDQLCQEFVGEARSQLATLTGEIALRNKVVLSNDSYVYGDLLSRSLKVPTGHDFTPVNWLRRVAEIHRTQTMGDGFTVSSSYHGVDIKSDPNNTEQLQLVNEKMKTMAEGRNKLFQAILRDNGEEALWARMVENCSVVGDSILKAWYDEDSGKYKLDMIEALEHFYVVWNKSNFREWDFTGYVYQISKQQAVDQFNVPPDVATSPLGMPLAVLSSANTVEYISTQPMVTIMEVNGRIQGWKSLNGVLERCEVGDETMLNAVIVGDRVKRVIDDPKYLPKYYIFPNKLMRRRPWGLPDVTDSAININQTYIETLSDWRTVASKVNFPKWKAFGFGLDVQMPKPKARTAEIIGLGEGQDIVPIQNPNSEASSELDFARQLAELKEAFVRETGISMQLFDMPDSPDVNSRQTGMIAMKSISDQVEARRQLWQPIIRKVFEDALDCLALWDDSIKELVSGDEDWYIRVDWPSPMRKDDPSYVTMLLNQFTMGTMSIQTMFEKLGYNAKEELDRISDEFSNEVTAAIHGKLQSGLAQLKIFGPPTSAPPKVNVNLKGDLNPYEVADIAAEHQITGPNAPYADVLAPQGYTGTRANDEQINKGFISNEGNQPSPNYQTPTPQTITPPTGNAPGAGVASAPGSGQPTPNTPQGNINQQAQRRGK